MEPLAGIFCALWTPTDHSGEVLWPVLDKHLSFVLDSGVAGIMALGSTGEFLHLSLEQRRQVLEHIVRACKSRGRRVIANVSDATYRHVVALGCHALAIGADCISVLPPWYFPFAECDLIEFFLGVARETRAPLALYNYPEVTGKKLSLDTIRSVARAAKVVAIKQSGAEFAYHQELLRTGRELGIPVLTGADTRLDEALRLGCSGAISGLANVIPEIFQKVYKSFLAGSTAPEETATGLELARRIGPLLFPLSVKAAMAARGFETGEPKAPVSALTQAVYAKVLQDLTAWLKTIKSLPDVNNGLTPRS